MCHQSQLVLIAAPVKKISRDFSESLQKNGIVCQFCGQLRKGYQVVRMPFVVYVRFLFFVCLVTCLWLKVVVSTLLIPVLNPHFWSIKLLCSPSMITRRQSRFQISKYVLVQSGMRLQSRFENWMASKIIIVRQSEEKKLISVVVGEVFVLATRQRRIICKGASSCKPSF